MAADILIGLSAILDIRATYVALKPFTFLDSVKRK
jgi:hypothetical protein